MIESKDYNNKYNFGPIKLIIYSFDQGDKNSFHNKFKVPVKDFGNIRIYRDSFQIYPYGETGNDWLDIDVRKAQGMFRYLGMRDIIGYLQIYREHNLQFIDATNRQGLEENEALDALKNFVKKEAIPKLEGYFFLKKNKTEEKQHKDNREEIKNATVSLKEIAKKINKTAPEEAKKVLELTKVIQEKNQKQDQIIRNQQQMVEVYKRISSKETLLHGTIHRVLMKNQNVQTAIYNQRDELEQFQIDDEIRKVLETTDYYILNNTKEVKKYLISARKHLLKKREVTIVNVFDQLNRVFRTERATLINKNIAYEIIGPKSITLKIDVNDFNVIFENLISNSRKSLMQVNNRSKKIEVKYEISRNNLNIFFIDNGMGIEKEHIPHIFTPFYTTSNEGFGMGMAIIDELIKSNNGEINVIVPREGEYGAKFQISFKLGG
ncbi:TPA: HAMP domain-containing histidine kinase [Bacillus cereus]|nr:HAMP domain-containing histidine kinase [Bacillus cereus]